MRARIRDLLFAIIAIAGLPLVMCVLVSHVVGDVPYHPVKCRGDECWLRDSNKKSPAVTPVKMYVGNYGWGVSRSQENNREGRPTNREIRFHKAWLEFSDEGRLHNEEQLTAIKYKIESLSKKKPIFLVTFMNGWHQNASETEEIEAKTVEPGSWEELGQNALKADYYFARQADQVRRWHEAKGIAAPEVLAIFIGWRGESFNKDPLNLVTISNRAKAADTIGGYNKAGGLYVSLNEIGRTLRDANSSSKMLVTGHSLGGRALAMAFLNEVATKPSRPLNENALIVLLAPAIGADCFSGVFKSTDQVQKPFLISVSSQDDPVIGYIYEFGRKVLIGKIPACDPAHPGNLKTIGNYRPFVTHTLQFTQEVDGFVKLDTEENSAIPKRNSVIEKNGIPVGIANIRDEPWFRNPDQPRSLAYASNEHCRDEAPRPNCSENDNDLYRMRFRTNEVDRVKVKNSRFWNIRTDRNTLDSGDPFRPTGLHNFVSTNLARLFAEFLYSE